MERKRKPNQGRCDLHRGDGEHRSARREEPVKHPAPPGGSERGARRHCCALQGANRRSPAGWACRDRKAPAQRDLLMALQVPAAWPAPFSGGTPGGHGAGDATPPDAGGSLRSIRQSCASMLLMADGDRRKAHRAMTVEVTVTNPAYWSDRAPQLVQLLRSAGDAGPRAIGDPTGKPLDPDRVLAIVDPAYWSDRPREL